MSKYPLVPLTEMADVFDHLREPVSEIERNKRVGLYPYYGATGQIGLIDGYRQDGKYVLLGEDGAPFLDPNKKKAFIVEGKCWVNNHAHVLKGKPNICEDDYLCIALNFADYSNAVTGSTRLKLPQNMMGNLLIPKPSIEEQREIARIYLEQFAEIEKAREATEIQRREIKFLKKATLNSLFQVFKNTPTVKLSECCSFNSGGTPSKSKPEYWNGDIPWFSPKDMKSFYLVNSIDKITEDAINSSAARLVPASTILVVNRSGILAHTLPIGILKQNSSFNQDIKAITPNKDFTSDFIAMYLKSQEETIIRHGVKMGATVHSLKAGFIENIDIPKVSIELQNEFCEKVLEINSLEADAMNAILSVNQELRTLPNKLLQKAFNEIENG